MKTSNLIWLLAGAGAIVYVLMNQDTADDYATDIVDEATDLGTQLTAAVVGWKNAGSGPAWVPFLNQVEVDYSLPQDMLARQAYQESRFIEKIIRGSKASSAGALGIMQMMPQYFNSVNVPTPYTDADVQNQIEQAAQQMASLYQSTGNWSLALAAYNAGLGNVQKYSGIPPFSETQNYVSQIVADVPSLQVA